MSAGCGSVTGQQRHLREGTEVCDDCLVAAARYMRWQRARKALGMPFNKRGEEFTNEAPRWASVGELSTVGAFMHDSARWSA